MVHSRERRALAAGIKLVTTDGLPRAAIAWLDNSHERSVGGTVQVELVRERIRNIAYENNLTRALRRTGSAIRRRWLALSFAHRFYRQACAVETAPAAAPSADLMETINRRGVPLRLHALVQLRVASQLASIGETQARAQLCRAHGWSEDQVGAVLLGNLNGSFSEVEKLVLRYAEDISRTPMDIDPQVVRELRACFTAADLVELTAAVAQENFRIRFSDANARTGAVPL